MARAPVMRRRPSDRPSAPAMPAWRRLGSSAGSPNSPRRPLRGAAGRPAPSLDSLPRLAAAHRGSTGVVATSSSRATSTRKPPTSSVARPRSASMAVMRPSQPRAWRRDARRCQAPVAGHRLGGRRLASTSREQPRAALLEARHRLVQPRLGEGLRAPAAAARSRSRHGWRAERLAPRLAPSLHGGGPRRSARARRRSASASASAWRARTSASAAARRFGDADLRLLDRRERRLELLLGAREPRTRVVDQPGRQAQPLGDGERLAGAGQADGQAVGRAERLQVELDRRVAGLRACCGRRS